jgi:hypothetical protein
LNETKGTESWISKRVEQELKDLANRESSNPLATIAFAVVFTLILLYFIAHQLLSTGFFNANFDVLAMLLLYGSLGEWIVVAVLEAIGRKNISRDIDAFGGIVFVVVSGLWLFVVFPFEFTYFANVLPESIRFLLQWISNDIGRVILVLWIIVNDVAAVYYGILRLNVRKAQKAKAQSTKTKQH